MIIDSFSFFSYDYYFFFFFQAEDGIRDWSVTGVQTCALPIFKSGSKGLTEQHDTILCCSVNPLEPDLRLLQEIAKAKCRSARLYTKERFGGRDRKSVVRERV